MQSSTPLPKQQKRQENPEFFVKEYLNINKIKNSNSADSNK